MKNRLLYLIALININAPVYAFSFEVSSEVKTLAMMFVKVSIGVIISSIIIAFGLWIFSLTKAGKKVKTQNSEAQNFTCEIDDTNTIDEAINTFLKINN